MIEAVIFDMDGTMVDTEKLWGDVVDRLAQRYGVTMNKEVHSNMMGRKAEDALSVFKEGLGIDAEVAELVSVRNAMVIENTSSFRKNEGLDDLLDLLDRLAIKKAVATSSFREFTYKILDQFNLRERFDVVLTGDDVEIGKPDPTMFLETAKQLTTNPESCLVLEDAQNGVEAARQANMLVFVIPHETSQDHDFSDATKIISSMREIDEEVLRSL